MIQKEKRRRGNRSEGRTPSHILCTNPPKTPQNAYHKSSYHLIIPLFSMAASPFPRCSFPMMPPKRGRSPPGAEPLTSEYHHGCPATHPVRLRYRCRMDRARGHRLLCGCWLGRSACALTAWSDRLFRWGLGRGIVSFWYADGKSGIGKLELASGVGSRSAKAASCTVTRRLSFPSRLATFFPRACLALILSSVIYLCWREIPPKFHCTLPCRSQSDHPSVSNSQRSILAVKLLHAMPTAVPQRR